MLKENQVYLFANGMIKVANQKFTSIKNDYCINFDKNSEIEECEDSEHISSYGFCFTTIDEINDFEQMRTVDAIGVIRTVSPITQINLKSSG